MRRVEVIGLRFLFVESFYSIDFASLRDTLKKYPQLRSPVLKTFRGTPTSQSNSLMCKTKRYLRTFIQKLKNSVRYLEKYLNRCLEINMKSTFCFYIIRKNQNQKFFHALLILSLFRVIKGSDNFSVAGYHKICFKTRVTLFSSRPQDKRSFLKMLYYCVNRQKCNSSSVSSVHILIIWAINQWISVKNVIMDINDIRLL